MKSFYKLVDGYPQTGSGKVVPEGFTEFDTENMPQELVDAIQAQEAMQQVKEAESAVQAHIDAKAQELGYDNINSIAKYLVAGNPFQAECESLSLWTAQVWAKAYEVQQAGTTNTVEELIAQLPVYGA